MDDEIEFAVNLFGLGEGGVEVCILLHVAGEDHFGSQRIDELADPAFHFGVGRIFIGKMGEPQLGPLAMQFFGDGPGNGVIVDDPQYQTLLPVHHSHYQILRRHFSGQFSANRAKYQSQRMAATPARHPEERVRSSTLPFHPLASFFGKTFYPGRGVFVRTGLPLLVLVLIASLVTPAWSLDSCCCERGSVEQADQSGSNLPPCCAARQKLAAEAASAEGTLAPRCDCQVSVALAAIATRTTSQTLRQLRELAFAVLPDSGLAFQSRLTPTDLQTSRAPDTTVLDSALPLAQLCRWLI